MIRMLLGIVEFLYAVGMFLRFPLGIVGAVICLLFVFIGVRDFCKGFKETARK